MSDRLPNAEYPVTPDPKDFDKKSGSLLERLLFNNRILIAILCFLITGILAYQATGLRLNAGFEKMIPAKHPYILNYLEHKNELGGLGNTVRIIVQTNKGTIFDEEYLSIVRQITDDVFLFPGVDRPFMKSLWTPAVRWIALTEEGFEGGPVISDEYDGSPEAIRQVRQNVERSGEIGNLVAPNFKSSIVHVPIKENSGDGERLNYSVLDQKLEQIRQKYEDDNINIRIVGFAKIVGDMIDGLQQMLLFFAITIAICTLVLYWYARCITSTLLVMLCTLAAVVWQLGFLSTLGYELDPYSILVPFLVVAIGLSHGAQKMNGIMQEIGRGSHKYVAVRYTFRRLFVTGLTALVTDAVGFAVLMVIFIPIIQDLAVTASIGVAVLIVTNLVLLPILLSFTGVNASAAHRNYEAQNTVENGANHRKHPVWAFLDLFAHRKWASRMLGLTVILGFVGFLISLQLEIGDLEPGAPELRADSRYNKDNAFLVEQYAASSDRYVVMVETPQHQCTKYNTLVRVDLLEQQFRDQPQVISTDSAATHSRHSAVGMNEGNMKWYEIPRNQNLLNYIVSRAPRELVNYNCDLLMVYAYLKDHKADTLNQVVKTYEDFATTHNTEEVRFLSAAGNAGIEAATNIVIERAHVQMLLLVFGAVIVLCLIAFRSWRAVVCAVVPLMLTAVLCQVLMVALGIGVKVATLPVIALGVGIGVDYALYVLSVTLARMRDGLSFPEAYYRALLFTGRVVVLTGITLGISVSIWALSPIKFQADMGILLAFMFIWNMVGALILLPALGYFLLSGSERPATGTATAAALGPKE